MFIVVKGENLEIPNNQMTIERLRKDIGKYLSINFQKNYTSFKEPPILL